MMAFTSILRALETRSIEQPEQQVYAYADEHGNIDQRITWRELAYRTAVLTGYLRRERGLQVGDRVLLVYPPSIDFVIAFAGCLRAGLIPVPVYPPNPRKFDSGMEAFHRIAHDCDAQLVLTSEQYEKTRNRGGVQRLAEQEPSRWTLALEWVSTDSIFNEAYEPLFGPTPKPDDVALIQYTSGSTSAPKGVVITHGNLAHQMEYTRQYMKLNADSRCVLWVPQYHDLGLIGGIVTALTGHMQLTLCSPYAFIKRPALWFELLHREQATHTAAPNFAYDLAVQKTTPQQRAQWDLSHIEVAMNAAEPVRAATLQRFAAEFAVAGFKPQSHLPSYGLAEHTVGVTLNGGTIKRFDRVALEYKSQVIEVGEIETKTETVALVSSGTWAADIDLRIVCPDSLRDCARGEVGEVWVNSPSKAAGYWQLPEQNERDFYAKIEGGNGCGYLRTGDLGFIHESELYICGRMKDVLIMGGRNIYPQDIEDSVAALDHAIKPVAVAAFTVDVVTGAEVGERVEEKLVLLVDIRKLRASPEELQALASALQLKILQDHQIACHAIAIAPIGSVLKTTSGKVRRQACRQRWLAGALEEKALYILRANAVGDQQGCHVAALAQDASRTQVMQAVAADILNLPDPAAISLWDSLTDQGMGSLAAVDFCQLYEQVSGEELSITQFFNAPTIGGLCELLDHQEAPSLTLDEAFRQQPDDRLIELHALRHYLRHNRYCQSGFRVGDWAVRPAVVGDVGTLQRLDHQEYGWLGEDATDTFESIQHQVETLNGRDTPWFWVLEKRKPNPVCNTIEAEIVGWYILQPTQVSPAEIASWAHATSSGTFSGTFDPDGKNLYLVAAGVSREYTKQAHRIMVLNALSLMAAKGMTSVSACLAMPGFTEATREHHIQPEDYVQLTDSRGQPKDAFLAFFKELWPAEHKPMRFLRDGYPPDQLSGGHGVCACVEIDDYRLVIDRVIDQLVQQRAALFGDIPLTADVAGSAHRAAGAVVSL